MEKRRKIHHNYVSNLNSVSNLGLPIQRQYVDPMWHLFPIRVDASCRRQIFDELRNQGIGVQVNYFPAHLHPVFHKNGFRRGQYPASESFYDSEISLPMHCELSDRDLELIVRTLTGLL